MISGTLKTPSGSNCFLIIRKKFQENLTFLDFLLEWWRNSYPQKGFWGCRIHQKQKKMENTISKTPSVDWRLSIIFNSRRPSRDLFRNSEETVTPRRGFEGPGAIKIFKIFRNPDVQKPFCTLSLLAYFAKKSRPGRRKPDFLQKQYIYMCHFDVFFVTDSWKIPESVTKK